MDRMRRLEDHAALAHLGVGEDAIDGADGRAGHALRPEPREPVVGRPPAESGLDQRDQHATVRDAITIGPEAQVALPLRVLDHAAEPRPELLGEDGDDQVTITRREGLIGDDRGVARAERPGDATVRPEILRNIREERDLAVEQRQVEVGALASPLATEERSGHRKRAEDPAREVAHRQAHAHRRPPRLAGDGHRPAHRLERQVEGRPVAIRPLLAVGGDRAEDHALVEGPELGVRAAETLHHAGAEVLPDDVGPTDEVVEDLTPGIPGEVERDGLLAAVDREEVRRLAVGEERRTHDPHRVAAVGVLDLDHLGAHVGEQHRAVRPREHAGEVEHADAREELHAVSA